MHILVTIYISYQSLLLSTIVLNNIIRLQRMYNKLVPDYFTRAVAYLEDDALIRVLGGPLSPYLGGLGHATQKILNFMGALRCFLVHSGAGVLELLIPYNYVTRFGKTCIVYTSDFPHSRIHKIQKKVYRSRI